MAIRLRIVSSEWIPNNTHPAKAKSQDNLALFVPRPLFTAQPAITLTHFAVAPSQQRQTYRFGTLASAA